MKVFYITLGVSFILAIAARMKPDKKGNVNLFFFTIITMILALVSGLRNNIGDTYYYKHTYTLVGPGFNTEGYEQGFIWLMKILKTISNDPQILIFATGTITTILILIILRKYSKDNYFELVIYLYITSGFYLFTMNGLRQAIAIAIAFTGTPFIIKGDFKKYLIVIWIALCFHSSAIIMIPAYFIVRTEAWSKTTLVVMILTVVGLIFYEPLMQIIAKIIGGKMAGYIESDNQEGANVIRIIIQLVPVVLAYIKRKELKEKWPESNVFVNMILMAAIIMFFSKFNWVFSRFRAYMQLYVFTILPYIIRNCFYGKERRLLYYGLIVCYFIYFWYDQYFTMHIVYSSDYNFEKLFLY